MSFVIRRKLSTLIPPKIASAKNLGSNPHAKKIQEVVKFYKALPQGQASFPKASSPIGKYGEKYFNDGNASAKPLLHLALGVILFGYSLEYYYHLRHHKGEH
ncbi:F1F0 ATP synthase subunit f, mitochondrial [Komagataella phaffii CBS 7435]|uniref:Subunit f of the F0 sector of mitochondrial F1F0 ATP synthase, which is a large, evolutionarily cons n=2 Tax=Komagataella phaffii TaxID=460519 RepID=C4R3F2_KOMPG|nr:uncharacterized protein PAS_chr3_0059 [Komagataella phaffii GS115]KAI0461661.1 ATP synthase f chain, mitochondrial precursor [Komagataella kurtzmanii]CAH2450295.1 F1F0 ATP synthase subunit f, mitochondrial [Komagataella phaffii CBS 7435]CAY69987.1 Subunit f of the F0 sector of mitochondrial F1F0 ATP synthase, which is a large, evolutionarily cons [Komagataella phaffii GS115]CCA40125.1 F1F0 ATP synthase subunit f, mitochondrial [Komagataella phaffii CBS 7435]